MVIIQRHLLQDQEGWLHWQVKTTLGESCPPHLALLPLCSCGGGEMLQKPWDRLPSPKSSHSKCNSEEHVLCCWETLAGLQNVCTELGLFYPERPG